MSKANCKTIQELDAASKVCPECAMVREREDYPYCFEHDAMLWNITSEAEIREKESE